MLGIEEVRNRLTPRKVRYDDPIRNAMGSLRHQMIHAANMIDQLAPEGREKSLALTKLEEALMWANKAFSSKSPLSVNSEDVPVNDANWPVRVPEEPRRRRDEHVTDEEIADKL